ncbi:hypothetical protein EYF80_049605 [Liparis tanakae]|uniref:Uncharacterized protein n=1 Tax=Liparis tanakae TaxID=230148 RepID=A0A4Z2FH33_9TELE|nr:hypothetical protein EYF80_049605 [Liparis tanakae]
MSLLWGPRRLPGGPASPWRCFLFPLADPRHQLGVGRRLGPHVLVLGEVDEDAEDAGGNVEGQGVAGPLLGSLRHLGGRARRSLFSPEQRGQRGQRGQRVAEVQDGGGQLLAPPLVSVEVGGPLAPGGRRQQQQSHAEETQEHTPHGAGLRLQGEEEERRGRGGEKLPMMVLATMSGTMSGLAALAPSTAMATSRQHHARGFVVAVDVIHQVLAAQSPGRIAYEVLLFLLPGIGGGSQHTLPQRGALEGGGVQQVEADLLRVALDFLQLAQHHAPLLLDLRLAQRAALHHLRQQLHGWENRGGTTTGLRYHPR